MSRCWRAAPVFLLLGCGTSVAEDGLEMKSGAVRPTLSYSTYLGGRTGGAMGRAVDSANAVGVDSSGLIYVAGFTMSLDFPQKDPIDEPELFENGYY
jgi:hypothetical protein